MGLIYDNGDKIPDTVQFSNVVIDEDGRTFSGDTVFAPNVYLRAKVIQYDMQFSADYKTIESGHVKLYKDTEKRHLTATYTFGKQREQLVYERYKGKF